MVDRACCEGGEFDFINFEVNEEEKQGWEEMCLLSTLYPGPSLQASNL